jgi:lipopolysaccharide transport system permease protein
MLSSVGRWQLLRVLTVSSWRSRYRNSVLGFAWGILEPLSLTLVFVLVFSVLTKGLYGGAAPYTIFVLLGTVLWSLFAQGTMQGGNGVMLQLGLVKKVYFPREYISLGYILTILVTTTVNLAVAVVLYPVYGLTVGWKALLFPVVVAIELLLVVGVAFLLAAIFIRVEDFRYLWQLLTALGLFASPVVYDPSVVPAAYVFWYNLNPMVGVLTASRDALIYDAWPPLWSIAYPALMGVVLLLIGYVTFKRSEHLFAERL